MTSREPDREFEVEQSSEQFGVADYFKGSDSATIEMKGGRIAMSGNVGGEDTLDCSPHPCAPFFLWTASSCVPPKNWRLGGGVSCVRVLVRGMFIMRVVWGMEQPPSP